MLSNDQVVSSLTAMLQTLRDATGAGRTTIRLDVPERGFHVNDVVSEARVPEQNSLKGVTSIDQRAAATVKWMERERRLLVQPDLSKADPPAPPALIAGYGAKAQMLGPIFRKDHLVGWISVHETTAPREWRASDVAALEEAVKATHRTLDAMG